METRRRIWAFGICFEGVAADGTFEGTPSLVVYRVEAIDRRFRQKQAT
jgi:hypothetical protein